ncbi:MAG: hypothetical protein QE487_01470 [Fluviicola sp.]|nr:hypothetical protein [Fluviicola sp.]
MKNRIYFVMLLVLLQSCNNSPENQQATNNTTASTTDETTESSSVPETRKKPQDFLPSGYIVFDEMHGDLNKDGLDDCILIIKGTAEENIVEDENHGKLDRNRRGILILLNKKGNYELAVKNTNCFSSENEDGGVYFPPELSLEIKKGKLFVQYSHGRYGYWNYMFRFNNNDFELIGYDASDNYGPVVNREVSINYLTKKKSVKVNVNESAEAGDEVFEETWEDIKIEKPIKLSEVKDFDELGEGN